MKLSLSYDKSRIYFKNKEPGFLDYTTFDENFGDWISKVPLTVNTQ